MKAHRSLAFYLFQKEYFQKSFFRAVPKHKKAVLHFIVESTEFQNAIQPMRASVRGCSPNITPFLLIIAIVSFIQENGVFIQRAC